MLDRMINANYYVTCFIFSGTWKVFTGNEIGSLLGWWQLQVHKKQASGKADPTDVYSLAQTDPTNVYFIASTVSSKMLKSIANIEGLSFEVYLSYI